MHFFLLSLVSILVCGYAPTQSIILLKKQDLSLDQYLLTVVLE